MPIRRPTASYSSVLMVVSLLSGGIRIMTLKIPSFESDIL
jgi:hypothetical protein